MISRDVVTLHFSPFSDYYTNNLNPPVHQRIDRLFYMQLKLFDSEILSRVEATSSVADDVAEPYFAFLKLIFKKMF